MALAAQILPMGLLLTPVEAYAAPAGWTLSSASLTLVSPSGPIVAGTPLQFRVIATYKNALGTVYTSDVTADATYSSHLKYPTHDYGTLSFTAGSYTVPSTVYSSNGALTITAIFQDSGSHQIAYAPGLSLVVTHG